MTPAYRSLWTSAGDGLRLHARDYGPALSASTPVVCLPGLARNAADFHDLATALASGDRPRRVLAIDYRGRGLSARDRDWQRYAVPIELDDLLQVLTVAGITEAMVVGTSRGGLIAMALAAQRPALLRGVVLNDIGPVIEVKGLVRIKGYVGKLPVPRTYEQGVDILRGLFDAQFPALEGEDWLAWAESTWRKEDGGLVLAYDPQLMRTLEDVDPEVPMAPLWPLFEAMKGLPVLALRGAQSDLLSAETLALMARAHPGLESMTVPGQGHAPLLRSREIVGRVTQFVNKLDRGAAA